MIARWRQHGFAATADASGLETGDRVSRFGKLGLNLSIGDPL
jgi:hypothetical protein